LRRRSRERERERGFILSFWAEWGVVGVKHINTHTHTQEELQ